MRIARAHPTLAASIALPLLVSAYYAAASYIPRLLAAPAQYDILYLTGYAGKIPNALHIEVADARLRATFVGENFGNNWPHLYRFRPATNQLSEIRIIPPAEVPLQQLPRRTPAPRELSRHPVPIPELENLSLHTSLAAPDGYYFHNNTREADLISLWQGRPTGSAYISKGSDIIALPATDPKSAPGFAFLGWVQP